MQLEYLREFKQLCIGCAINFSRAAEQLHMIQPALSNHVRALETELGIELIQRGKGRPSCLTPAGVVFLDYAPFPQGREEVLAWVDTSGPLAAENPVRRDPFENITIPLVSRPTAQMSQEWVHGICEQLDHQPTCTQRYAESINSFLLNQLKATDVQFLPAHYRHQPMIALVPTRELRSLEPPVYTTIHVAFRKEGASDVAQQFKNYLQTLQP